MRVLYGLMGVLYGLMRVLYSLMRVLCSLTMVLYGLMRVLYGLMRSYMRSWGSYLVSWGSYIASLGSYIAKARISWPPFFSPFCLESWVCITQTQVRYQKKGLFMLYNNGLTFAYEKVQSRGRKWPKRMLKATILENGGCRHSATCRQLTPSKILICAFIRLHRHITI